MAKSSEVDPPPPSHSPFTGHTGHGHHPLGPGQYQVTQPHTATPLPYHNSVSTASYPQHQQPRKVYLL